MNKFIKSKIIIPILCILGSIGVSVGTTYALFTSNANTNIAVTSGKVNLVATLGDLDLYTPKLIASDGSSIINDEDISSGTTFGNGGTATLGTNTLSLSNIAPGDKATFKIHFTNSSNVDIKYRVLYEDITEYEPSAVKLGERLAKSANDVEIKGPVLVNWTFVSAGATIPDIEICVRLPIGEFDVQDLSSSLRFSVEAVQANAYTNSYKKVTLISHGENVVFSKESFDILPGDSF